MTEEKTTEEQATAEETPADGTSDQPLTRRQVWANRLRYFLVGVTLMCVVGVGYLVLTHGVSSPPDQSAVLAYTPSLTPTVTSTACPTPTTAPPTNTPTPGPTHTPLPPFRYIVKEGDTWLGLAIYFDVSLESLLALNGRSDSDFIQRDEEILIPNPTYTPTPAATPLPTFEVLKEIAPEQCREHTIAAGETLIAIAIKYDVGVQLIQSVNNIADPDLVKEGQRLCIPLVTPGPAPSPTFGPSPTSALKPLHPAPQLLYPPAGVEVPAGSQHVTLQWTVAGFLAPDEHYMVEIRDLSRQDSRAVRGFVKTTLWRLPETIHPAVGTIETFAWRVSVVRGEGEPTGQGFRWERSGLPSGWQSFLWMGVARSSTPTPTP